MDVLRVLYAKSGTFQTPNVVWTPCNLWLTLFYNQYQAPFLLLHFPITLYSRIRFQVGGGSDALRKRRRWVRPFHHLTVKENITKLRLGHSMNPNFAQGLKSWCGDAMPATIDKVLHNLTSLLLLKAYLKSECNYASSFSLLYKGFFFCLSSFPSIFLLLSLESVKWDSYWNYTLAHNAKKVIRRTFFLSLSRLTVVFF